jgi:capsid protein
MLIYHLGDWSSDVCCSDLANMASLSEVCSKRGRDWRVVLRQRAAEKAMEREMGVEPQQPAARQPQPQEQPA